jgi:signal transduction histidine kinase
VAIHAQKKSPTKSHHLVPISGRMLLRKANLNEIVQEVAGLLPQHLNEAIHVKMELAPERLPIMVDKTGMGEVVMNLVKNAVEAMPCGGMLTMSTSLVSSQAQRHLLPVGSCALMSVTDTGVGMDKLTMERMFEPYFTRKPGVRRGLGLSIADSIIRRHNGCFKVESAVGKGTIIKIYLPLVRGQEEDAVLLPRSFFARTEGELADTA